MEIKKINVDTAAIGGSRANLEKEAKKETKAIPQVSTTQGSQDSEKLIDSMNLMGLYNQINIRRSDDFLSKLGLDENDSFDEAVNKLLASGKVTQKNIDDMNKAVNGEFALGVQSFADSLEEEFPQVFDEASRNALAARMYAQE